MIKQGLHSRPDWEQVIGPVIDYLLTRPDVDAQRIALVGLSLGGYLAPRAASKEHRLAACIADPGQFDVYRAFMDRMPPFLARGVSQGNSLALRVLKIALDRMVKHPTKGWGIRRGMWVHGVSTALEYLQLTRTYTLNGCAEQITCPTLICYADHDDLASSARQVFDALRCSKQFIAFTSDEGAGEHCEDGNRSLFHQRAFDWLDEIFQENR